MACELSYTVFRFVLASLAVWRISFLLVREDGPGKVLMRLRKRVEKCFLGELLKCVKCTGVWVSLPFAIYVGGDFWQIVVVWLAIAGVTALIDEVTKPPFEWQEEKGDGLLQRDSDRSDD
jgi:hypothetical protein